MKRMRTGRDVPRSTEGGEIQDSSPYGFGRAVGESDWPDVLQKKPAADLCRRVATARRLLPAQEHGRGSGHHGRRHRGAARGAEQIVGVGPGSASRNRKR